MGTEIAYGEAMVPDDKWERYLDDNWDRKAITEETAKFPELIPQVCFWPIILLVIINHLDP